MKKILKLSECWTRNTSNFFYTQQQQQLNNSYKTDARNKIKHLLSIIKFIYTNDYTVIYFLLWNIKKKKELNINHQ